jgi:hypothetical protein
VQNNGAALFASPVRGREGASDNSNRLGLRAAIVVHIALFTIVIAPQGHSWAHIPQPLQ